MISHKQRQRKARKCQKHIYFILFFYFFGNQVIGLTLVGRVIRKVIVSNRSPSFACLHPKNSSIRGRSFTFVRRNKAAVSHYTVIITLQILRSSLWNKIVTKGSFVNARTSFLFRLHIESYLNDRIDLVGWICNVTGRFGCSKYA